MSDHKLSKWEEGTPLLDEPVKFLTGARNNHVEADTYRALNVPRFSIYRAAAFAATIPVSTATAVPWDTVLYDPDGMWASATPTVITCRTAGLYEFSFGFYWDGCTNASSYRQVYLMHSSGVPYAQVVGPPTQSGATGTLMRAVDHIPMNSNDTVILTVAHNDAGAEDAFVGRENTALKACLISTI